MEKLIFFNPRYVHLHQDGYDCEEEYTIAVCAECKEVSIFFRSDLNILEPLGREIEYFYLWPIEKRFLDIEVPNEVGNSYNEAVEASKNRLNKSAAVMIGRAVEAVCKDYDPNIKTIYSGLEAMLKDGSLSQEMYNWATELRLLRNIGAHSTEQEICGGDVENALDFLSALLTIIYDIRPKYEKYINVKSKS